MRKFQKQNTPTGMREIPQIWAEKFRGVRYGQNKFKRIKRPLKEQKTESPVIGSFRENPFKRLKLELNGVLAVLKLLLNETVKNGQKSKMFEIFAGKVPAWR